MQRWIDLACLAIEAMVVVVAVVVGGAFLLAATVVMLIGGLASIIVMTPLAVIAWPVFLLLDCRSNNEQIQEIVKIAEKREE